MAKMEMIQKCQNKKGLSFPHPTDSRLILVITATCERIENEASQKWMVAKCGQNA
jgi:hypothetical protein